MESRSGHAARGLVFRIQPRDLNRGYPVVSLGQGRRARLRFGYLAMTSRTAARAFLLCLVLGPASPACAQDPGLMSFLLQNRCLVVDRLRRIHDAPPHAEAQNRFLILSLKGRHEAYSQCVFEDGNTAMICEVASGYIRDGKRTLFLPPENIAAIGRAGFSTDDSKGNFVARFAIPDPPDYAAIATMMLTGLYAGWHADLDMRLRLEAPLVTHGAESCDAVS